MRQITAKEFIEELEKVYYKDELAVLNKALDFATLQHEGQKRKSGEPYISHPINVAGILVKLGIHYTAVAAALLHDILEDCEVTETELKDEFGTQIVELVKGVTKLGDFKFGSKKEEQAENFRMMFFAMSKNHHVLVIKLADRLHNMRTIKYLAPDKRLAMATETQEIYAPLASRLGLSYIKCELQDRCFELLHPEEFKELNAQVKARRKKIDVVLQKIQEKLVEILQVNGIEGKVSGRPKHLYSIYRKMTKKDDPKTIEQIFDLTAVRVILNTVPECYTVLGAVHDAWRPMRERFKDYIAVKKSNNYQSLHTTVMTDFGMPCEIQIRTHEMHRVAEFGIAAHWMYKERRTEATELDKSLAWLRYVTDVENTDSTTSVEFLEALKFDFSHKEIFVFTPQSEIITLPEGSTPVDFAYRVHSAVGDSCVGAMVNEKIAPLNTPLKSGDYVKIITSKTSKGPSRDWLKFVKTTQAITKIKAHFKKLAKADTIERGRAMLEEEAKRRGYNLPDLWQPKWLDEVMRRYVLSSVEDLYAAIGYGGVTVGQIIPKLIDLYKKHDKKQQSIQNFSGKAIETCQSIIVSGHDDLLVRLAQCCTPVPGDEIIGFVSMGRGIAVHRITCSNLKGIPNERLIKTEWADTGSDPFVVQLRVESQNTQGLILRITTLISSMNLPIHSLNARSDKPGHGIIDVGVRVKEIAQIEQLIRKIEGIPEVEKVFRS